MLVPLRWLGEWIDLPPLDRLVAKLTDGGLEVDAVEHTGPDLAAFRVGHVVEHGRHPDADRLSLCKVDLGDGEPVDIVCGAPNVAAGQKVAVASPGMRLPDGKKLKKSKIRGVVSNGMICSGRELGLSDEHEGILVLDDDARVGAPLDEVVEAGETVLEIYITPNRGDCASMLGMAREVCAQFGGELRLPETAPPEGERTATDDVRIEIDDREGCHRYDARVIRGVTVAESPEWLQDKLNAAGLRPINNIVDVTNLVLLEFGQPLHAFDLDRIRGGVVRVRSAEAGERFETLDGESRELVEGDLLIADGERAVALAGVMGGANSEVGDGTTDVLLESAHFHPTRVRRTARRLGLSTDASYRFERGVDREGIGRAADRAARLIAELGGGRISQGFASATGEPPSVTETVALDPARVNRLLGTDLAPDAVRDALRRVGIEVTASGEHFDCRVPSHRNDIHLPQDLVEEVARMHGYDRIEPSVQSGPLLEGHIPDTWPLGTAARDALRYEGGIEIMAFPFLDPADLDRIGLEADDPRREQLRLLNPIVESESALRTHLLPSLLRLVRENRNRQADRIGIFEVARTYPSASAAAEGGEPLWVCAVFTDGEDQELWEPSEPAPLFFRAKGIAERLLERLGRETSLASGSQEPYLHPGASCTITAAKQTVGQVGELHPDVAAAFEIDVATAVIELDLSALEQAPPCSASYSEVSRHPSVKRDLAFLVGVDQPAGEILEAIRKQAGSILQSVVLFDRYEGKGVAGGRVSLAFRLVFQRTDRSLTDAEVNKVVDRVVQMLAHRFGGELR